MPHRLAVGEQLGNAVRMGAEHPGEAHADHSDRNEANPHRGGDQVGRALGPKARDPPDEAGGGAQFGHPSQDVECGDRHEGDAGGGDAELAVEHPEQCEVGGAVHERSDEVECAPSGDAAEVVLVG